VISHSEVIEHTKKWLSDIVIGHNFCPFAKREVVKNRVHFHVEASMSLEGCLLSLYEQCCLLDECNDIETTLIMFPLQFKNFDDFLELVDLANHFLVEQGYNGVYQLATFHPEYQFDGEEFDDVSNYTNRSPYPMLHIIRETSMERALKHYPDPENIPVRNIEVARNLGSTYFQQYLAQFTQN